MKTEKIIKRLREGEYLAEIEIELRERPGRDYATMTLEDVRRLERVRKALASGDLPAAAREATLFVVKPIGPSESNAA